MACTTTVLTRFDAAAFPMRPLFKGGVYLRAVFISKPHDFLNIEDSDGESFANIM